MSKMRTLKMNPNQNFVGHTDLLEKISGTKLVNLTLLEHNIIPMGLINILARTWQGETDKNEFFVLREHNGVINIGINEIELKAKYGVKRVGIFGLYRGLTIQEILDTLKVSYDFKDYWELL